MYIAQAIKDNGVGHLFTCDIDPAQRQKAKDNISEANLSAVVTISLCKGIDLIEKNDIQQCDFAFLDSDNNHGYENVKDEMLVLRPILSKNAIVVLHDIVFKDGPQRLFNEIIGMKKFPLLFSRGLGILQKL